MLFLLFALLYENVHGHELELLKGGFIFNKDICLPFSMSLAEIVKDFEIWKKDEYIFVKIIEEKTKEEIFRPVFMSTSLDPFYLYVDKSENIRSIGKEHISNFLKGHFDKSAEKNLDNVPKDLRNATYKIHIDLMDEHPKTLPKTVFEECENAMRCYHFYVSEKEDAQVTMVCPNFFPSPRRRVQPNNKLVIKQWKLSQNVDKKKMNCSKVEQGIPEQEKNETKCQMWGIKDGKLQQKEWGDMAK